MCIRDSFESAPHLFPDPVSQSIAEAWRAGAAKALEQQFKAFVPERTASAA